MSTAEKYRETLHRWAAQFVPDGATVTRIDITYDDGYEPTFTDRPESLWVGIKYAMSGTEGWSENLEMSQMTSIGELLTALFQLEDAELSDPT